jgi:oligopeptide transport system permease protein
MGNGEVRERFHTFSPLSTVICSSDFSILNPPMAMIENSETTEKSSSLWKDAWYRLQKNRMAVVGLILFILVTLICLIGPFLTGYTYEETALSLKASAPMERLVARTDTYQAGQPKQDYIAISNVEDEFLDKPEEERKKIADRIASGHSYTEGTLTYRLSGVHHLFGTDPLGRDLLTRLLVGGRISLAVGFAGTLVSLTVGVFWGAIAGFVGGKLDDVMMRIADIIYALPFTGVVILLMVLYGRNFILLFVAIGLVNWINMARIVRGQISSLKRQEFTEAAVSLGLSPLRIMMRHLLPNVFGPIIIYATLTIPSVMLLEAVLSFLGLGVQPPLSSWGVLIDEGSQVMETYPWLLLIPASMFSVTLMSLNFLGDGLRDALDPRSGRM